MTAADTILSGLTPFQCLERHRADCPERLAFVDSAGSLTHARLHEHVLALAAGLRSLGIRKGDVVAVQLPNGIEFVLSYLAASCLGAVVQTIHMPYRGEIESLLAHGGAKVFVCPSSAKDFSPARFATGLGDRLPALRAVVAVGLDAPEDAIAFWDLGGSAADDIAEAVGARDPNLLLYTSGTTSAPKGVQATPAMFLENAGAAARELGVEQDWRILSAAPFTHLYGLLTINMAMVTGACTAALPAFSPHGLATAIDGFAPHALFLAPAHVTSCIADGLLTPQRLSGVRIAMISGSHCPEHLAAELQAMMPHGKVCQLWGMSELQIGAFTRPGDDAAVRMTSVGRASAGTELRIADGTAPLPAGAEGELQIRGPSVFGGYRGNEAGTADAFTADGWFRSGDLACIDEAGIVRLTGRLKDIINRGGVKFNPTEIEALIARHPAVAECAIVPVPDPILGEKACCFVVVRDGRPIDLDQIREWLGEHAVAKNRWPERLERIDAMPLTPTRKVRKGELAARLAARP